MKKQANFPKELDILDVDRKLGDVVTSDSYDVIEDAITKIEAELRRITKKSTTTILTHEESGVIELTASEEWTLTLPLASECSQGLPFLLYKVDDNRNRITVVGQGESINGASSYIELNYKYAWVYLKADVNKWNIVFKSQSLDMGNW